MTPKTGRTNLLLPGVIAVVVVAALVALIATIVSGNEEEKATGFDTTAAAVSGKSLQPLPADHDPAVGQQAPLIDGIGLDGSPLTAPLAGRPTVILFLAHWCPHCRAEVPVVQNWVDDGNLPDGVDLVGVATAINPERPNFPPSKWLESEGWTAPTIADGTNAAADAYGLSAFPFWVAVDAQGKIVARTTGELTTDQIESLVQAAMTNATTTTGT